MSLHGYSQGSIAQWANNNFPADFRQLPGARQVGVQLHKVFSPGSQGYIKCLVIGIGTDEKGTPIEILAWLDNNSMIIGYVTKVGSSIQETRFDSTESAMESITGFQEPFGSVVQLEGEANFAKLETLVRYYFLLKGSTQAVKDHIKEFQEHFGDACQDIAAAHGTDSGNRPNAGSGTRANTRTSSASPKDHDLYDFEAFVGGLCNSASDFKMSSQSSKSPNNCLKDEGARVAKAYLHTSPTSHQPTIRLDTDDGSPAVDVQEVFEIEIKNLRRKVQTLDNRLMMAEGRARTAEQDAARWRDIYEQLKKDTDGVSST